MSRLTNLPNPPPGAHPVQLELWRRVLHRRYRQIEALSPSTFNLFANGIASDYENSLLENSQMDLSKSHYSSFLLPRHEATTAMVDGNTSNNNNTAKQIAVHLLGLFYTAIDERISPPERQFAIDIVKRDFALLDDLLKGKDRIEDNNSDSGDDYVVGKHGRDEEEEEEEGKEEHNAAAEMPKKKHARKDPPLVDDTNNTGLLDSGEIQNSQSDRSNEEGEHEREKSNTITTVDEGGETVVASTGPSTSTSKHHKADEGAGDEMQVDESNDDLETATQNNDGAEEVTADDDGGEGEKLGTSLNISEPDVLQNKGDSGADDDSGGRGTKSSMPSQDLNLEGINDDERTSEFSTKAAEPLPSKEGDTSIEQAVAAHDDVVRPAENGTLQDETQLKEPIEASGSGCAAKALASGESGTHSEVEDTDKVMETEAASCHLSEPTHETAADATTNAVEPVSAAVDTQASIPLPPPRVYSGLRHLNFYSDNFVPSDNDPKELVLASGSLHPREPCTVQYDTGYHHLNYCATMDDETSLSINSRLARSEPYWKIVDVLCRRDTVTDIGEPTKVSTKTASCKDDTGVSNPPLSCAMVTVDLAKEGRNSAFATTRSTNEETGNSRVWGVDWGEETKSYKSGDRRLLLRTLPLSISSKESRKRADCHLWPKGTFVQLKIGDEIREHVVKITQRQQQHHEPKKWSGQSEALDLTPYVQNTDLPFDVKLCCREAVRRQEVQPYGIGAKVTKFFDDGSGEMRPFSGTVVNYDSKYKLYRIVYEDEDEEELTREEVSGILVTKSDHGSEDPPKVGSYAVHVAICEYVHADRLFDELTGNRVGDFVIPAQSLESVKQKAIESLKQQTISIVDSESDGDEARGNSSDCHVFSLHCPITKTVIDTPVRGRDCSHLQCFDLRNFLHANKNPSAGRWRCGVCQRFLCCEDLVRCGLFDAMLGDLRADVSSTRHKVSFETDGRWKLMEQKKVAKAETLAGSVNSKDRFEPEVIDLSSE